MDQESARVRALAAEYERQTKLLGKRSGREYGSLSDQENDSHGSSEME